MQKEDDEHTPAELAAMIDGAQPAASMIKLGVSDDWIVSALCPNCDDHHHFLVTSSMNKRKKKPFDCFELCVDVEGGVLAPMKAGPKSKPKQFVSVDEAAEFIEEYLEDDEDDGG